MSTDRGRPPGPNPPARPSREAEGTASTILPGVQTDDTVALESQQPAGPVTTVELPVVAPDAYVNQGEHARGGLGRILRAHDRRLDRPVAIKEAIDDSRAMTRRFVREAMVTARLQHPGIVPVYEAGRWP